MGWEARAPVAEALVVEVPVGAGPVVVDRVVAAPVAAALVAEVPVVAAQEMGAPEEEADQAAEDRVLEVREVWDLVVEVRATARAAGDGVPVRQQWTCGPEAAAAAARPLFLAWSPASAAGAASRRKKSSSEFSVR